ncbi:MAG: hypothetical protein BWY32_01417 [bacterium ADurb.Bin243]|nr:MAG: hypothetical protein BWY32_01417 [bacterium ADurb.Bin243]HOD42400.1 hypothetical protein [Candidatus Wallbacteria bacterium]
MAYYNTDNLMGMFGNLADRYFGSSAYSKFLGTAFNKPAKNSSVSPETTSVAQPVTAPASQSAVQTTPKIDTAVVSKTAQKVSVLYEQVKTTGSENAAAFRSALVSMATNKNSFGSVDSFLSFGITMAETGNLKKFNDMSIIAAGMGKMGSAFSNASSKMFATAHATAQKFGAEAAGNFVGAAKSIMSRFGADTDKNSQLSAMKNFNKLWEKTSGASGFTAAQTTERLSRLTRDIEKKGSLSELNAYLKEELKAAGEEEEKEENTAAVNNGGGKTSFANYNAAAESRGAIITQTLNMKNSIQGNDFNKGYGAYRNNINAYMAGNLITNA